MTTTPTTLDALTSLNAALTDLAAALASGDTAGVLAAEAPIASALERMATAMPTPAADRAQLVAAVQRTRLTLVRCQALGASIADLADALAPRATYTAPATRRPS
jgi:hypothetical protein